ncbi:unnamed protein product [Lepeophtheirus salmonis]|uniref:(salmon louse) hypothetical protein n=1 Tax=Lepeophtheirus salmonis TaxID=72036 RepID=A0A7R8CFR6_LEPSM|nr:unnamed protein product [Lepeophtheirus salmonis]CAF2808941.1 unnamed protein product [Lepeophtheirus salmonis]
MLASEYSRDVQRACFTDTILAFLKNKSGISHQSNILMSLKLLEYITEEEELEYNDHIIFIIEQLQLHLSPLKGRIYSSRLLRIASLWQNTSLELYNQLWPLTLMVELTFRLDVSFTSNSKIKITFETMFVKSKARQAHKACKTLASLEVLGALISARHIKYVLNVFVNTHTDQFLCRTRKSLSLGYRNLSYHGRYLLEIECKRSKILLEHLAGKFDTKSVVAISKAENGILNRFRIYWKSIRFVS